MKTRGVLGRSHFLWQHETDVYGWPQGSMPKLKRPANETSVVDQEGEQDGIHPTQKPVELFRRPMLWHTKPGDWSMNPRLGSGTWIVAAEMTGRRCFALEQEPAYVDVAVRRWEQYTGVAAERREVPFLDYDSGHLSAVPACSCCERHADGGGPNKPHRHERRSRWLGSSSWSEDGPRRPRL